MSKPLTRRDLANIPACLLKIKAGNTSIAYLDGSWIIGTRFAEFSRLFTIGFLSLHKVDLNIKNVRIWWGDKGGDKLKYFALTCLPRIYIMDVGIDSQGQNYRIQSGDGSKYGGLCSHSHGLWCWYLYFLLTAQNLEIQLLLTPLCLFLFDWEQNSPWNTSCNDADSDVIMEIFFVINEFRHVQQMIELW